MITVQRNFREDQYPTYSHMLLERREKMTKAFINLVHLHRNSFFCLGATWTTSYNAPNSNPTPCSCLFSCRPRGGWHRMSAHCARRPLPSTGKQDSGSILLTKPLVFSSQNNVLIITDEILEVPHSRAKRCTSRSDRATFYPAKPPAKSTLLQVPFQQCCVV